MGRKNKLDLLFIQQFCQGIKNGNPATMKMKNSFAFFSDYSRFQIFCYGKRIALFQKQLRFKIAFAIIIIFVLCNAQDGCFYLKIHLFSGQLMNYFIDTIHSFEIGFPKDNMNYFHNLNCFFELILLIQNHNLT